MFKAKVENAWDEELQNAYTLYCRAMPENAYSRDRKSQRDEVLREFFDSIQAMIESGEIDSFKATFDHFDKDLPSLEQAIRDAERFTNKLFGELREDSIPDLDMSFSTNWRYQREERIRQGKGSRQDEKDLAKYYFVHAVSANDHDAYKSRVKKAEQFHTESEMDELREAQNFIWKHLSFKQIFANGEPQDYYRHNFFGIATYGLVDLAKTYCDQSALKSRFFERLLLDALVFSALMLRIRQGFGLASNEVLQAWQVRSRLTMGGWANGLRLVLSLVFGALLLLIDETRYLGFAWFAFIAYRRWSNRRKKQAAAQQFEEMISPYELLRDSDTHDGWVDPKVVRRSLEEIEMKYRVFPPISFRLLDRMSV